MNKEYLCINDKLEYETKGSTPKYVEKGVPLLTSKNLVNGKILKEPSQLISIKDSIEINKRSKVDENEGSGRVLQLVHGKSRTKIQFLCCYINYPCYTIFLLCGLFFKRRESGSCFLSLCDRSFLLFTKHY